MNNTIIEERSENIAFKEGLDQTESINFINEQEIKNFKNVNKLIFNKLKDLQLLNIRMIANYEVCELMELGFSKLRSEKLIGECKDNLFCSFRTGEQVYQERKKKKKLKFFVKEIDNLLKGGLETGSLTEIHGEFGTGKTQIVHHLCVTAQAKCNTSANGSVIYIDTETTFRPEKLEPICARFNLDFKEIKKNIHYLQPTSADQLCHLIQRLNTEKFEDISGQKLNRPIKLIIIDSIIKHFRGEFIGRGMLSDRQQRLGRLLNVLNNYALKSDCVVILINQMCANVDSFGPSLKAVGGHILHHTATYRLSLKKAPGIGNRIMTIVDAPDIPHSAASYIISDMGLIVKQEQDDI